MVDLIAAKKAPLNNKALNEISSDVLLDKKYKFKKSDEKKIVVEVGDYKISFIADSTDEFGDFDPLSFFITAKLLPTSGTVEKIIVEKDGKKLYEIKDMDLPIEDLLEKIVYDEDSGKELAEYIFDDDDFICGSNKNDKLYGFDGDDYIKSRKGKDKSWGGDDDDTFFFNEYGKKHFDKIKDFDDGNGSVDEDTIELGSKFKKKLGTDLTADEFVVGEKATESKAQMGYDDGTGKVWFDKDGTGGKDAKLVAKLDKFLDIDEGTFVIA